MTMEILKKKKKENPLLWKTELMDASHDSLFPFLLMTLFSPMAHLSIHLPILPHVSTALSPPFS